MFFFSNGGWNYKSSLGGEVPDEGRAGTFPREGEECPIPKTNTWSESPMAAKLPPRSPCSLHARDSEFIFTELAVMAAWHQ